jgi:hypothetical protein
MPSRVASISVGALTGEAELDGGVITTRLAGTADMRAIVPLERMLCTLHDGALAASATEVVVDLRDLEFMNSSCFIKFVSWLGKLEESATKYRIRFISTRRYHWQKRSLHALRCFASELVLVENR